MLRYKGPNFGKDIQQTFKSYGISNKNIFPDAGPHGTSINCSTAQECPNLPSQWIWPAMSWYRKSNSYDLEFFEKYIWKMCGSSNCDKLLPEDWIVHWRPVIWLTLHFSPSNSAMWSPGIEKFWCPSNPPKSLPLVGGSPSHQHHLHLLAGGDHF